MTGRWSLFAGIVAGFAFFAAVHALALARSGAPYIGEFIYNYYFLSILEGSLTVPVQIIGLEGHYTEAGEAFVYHGLAPLVTRALAYPFVDLTLVDLRPLTIWVFSAAGTAFYYALLVSMLRTFSGRDTVVAGGALLWAMVWVTGAGLLLVMNGSFFHEPIAIAYAAQGALLYCLWRLWQTSWSSFWAFLAMAVLAALCVHARPHVAVGLYAVAGLVGLYLLWLHRARALPVCVAAMAVLLASGLFYMNLNALRFGSALQVDGSVVESGRIVYGFVYWGFESEDSPRFVAAVENGRFNPMRIVPNFIMYHLSMGEPFSVDLFKRLTAPLGDIRLEFPMVGMLFLWPVWVVLAAIGLVRRGLPRGVFWLMLLAVLPAAVLIYSYPTITMRYRVELWPLHFVLGSAALVALGASGAVSAPNLRRRLGTGVAVGALIGVYAFFLFSDWVNWEWGTLLRSWEDCSAAVAEQRSLGPDHIDRLCVIDRPDA